MRAAVLGAGATAAVITEVELGRLLPGEVLIRTVAASVCHTDFSALQGLFSFPTPMVMGHEGAGVVEEVGAAVTTVRVGDHVVTTLSDFCGHCRYCVSGRTYLCKQMNRGRSPSESARITLDGTPLTPFCGVGAFAEHVIVNQNAVVSVDKRIGLDRAALLGCSVLTGLGAVFRTAQVQIGDTVAVLGCGGVGLNIIQGARIAGATRIIAIDPVPAKRQLAQDLGATHAIGADPAEVKSFVRDLTDGGVDHAFESAGRVDTIEQAFMLTGRGGTTTVVGAPGNVSIQLPAASLMLDRRIQGSLMGSNRFRLDVPAYVQLYLQGTLRLDELISGRFTLDELEQAWDAFRSGTGARSIIVI